MKKTSKELLNQGRIYKKEMDAVYCYVYNTEDYRKYAAMDADSLMALAENNDGLALNELGDRYCYAMGLEENNAKAIECYEKASELGVPRAYTQLSFLYNDALVSKEDGERALGALKKAAELGDVYAENYLSNCYLRGNGVEQDDRKCLYWLRKSANRGYYVALMNLAGYYDKREMMSNRDEICFDLHLKAVEAAEKSGIKEPSEYLARLYNSLGVYYDNVYNNPEEAVKWYKRAIDNNSTLAKDNLESLFHDLAPSKNLFREVGYEIKKHVKWFIHDKQKCY